MKRFSLIAISAIMAVFTYLPIANAGNAWLPAPGGGSVSLSLIYQTADEYYKGTTKGAFTLSDNDLIQKTAMVKIKYGLKDSLAFDLALGGSQASKAGAGPKESDDETGLTDINLGLTVGLVDEAENPQSPSVALRVGAIKSGGYDTGYINSIGDGGNGFEISGIVGKFLSDSFAVSGEFGYRIRNESIPEALFANATASLIVSNVLGISFNYTMEDSIDGLDIGGEGFSPDRFPELEEDVHTIGSTLTVLVGGGASLSGSYTTVIDGRNTADYDIFAISFGYAF